MKLINSKIYVECDELVVAGVSLDTISKAKYRNSNNWNFIQDPSDARKVLIEYEALTDKYKLMVIAAFGDPSQVIKQEFLTQYITGKPSDIDFLNKYRLSDGRKLPADALKNYINATKILHFLATYGLHKNAKSLGYSNLGAFWSAVSDYIRLHRIDLPCSQNHLRKKLQQYQKEGPECVISKKYCNDNSKKVKDEVCVALLMEMMAHANQFEDTMIAIRYNEWATQNGHKAITPATVGNYRHKHKTQIVAFRNGLSDWRNKFDRSVHQVRPSAPLYLINSDDNDLDLYFIKLDGKAIKTHYFRPVLVVLMDSFNDYILGYAVGNSQTIELVREAYLNAIHHIKELTGDYYFWHQIKADSWGKKALFSWYNAQANFSPTRIGNSRGKIIERAFGQSWHQELKRYINYAGHNVKAKSSMNRDAVELMKRDFPLMTQAPDQIKDFIDRLRNQLDRSTGLSKKDSWLQAFEKLDATEKRPLEINQRFQYYGKLHTHTNQLTKEGIIITIDGERRIYEVSDQDYRSHVGRTFKIAYDPYDNSSIMAFSEDESIQIIAHQARKVPMAFKDMKEGDRAYLNVLLDRKDEYSQWMLNTRVDRQQILQRNRIDAESLLMAGVLQKELKMKAERNYQLPSNNQLSEDPYDKMELPPSLNLEDEDE